MECTFAINSPELSGIVVIKNKHDKLIEQEELNIKQGNDKRSANITGLPAGQYNASVYDSMNDEKPAYQHSEFLQIMAPSPTPTPSRSVHTGTIIVLRTVVCCQNIYCLQSLF